MASAMATPIARPTTPATMAPPSRAPGVIGSTSLRSDVCALITSPISSGGAEKKSATLSARSEEHTSELQSPDHLVCRLLLEKKKKIVDLMSGFDKHVRIRHHV